MTPDPEDDNVNRAQKALADAITPIMHPNGFLAIDIYALARRGDTMVPVRMMAALNPEAQLALSTFLCKLIGGTAPVGDPTTTEVYISTPPTKQ